MSEHELQQFIALVTHIRNFPVLDQERLDYTAAVKDTVAYPLRGERIFIIPPGPRVRFGAAKFMQDAHTSLIVPCVDISFERESHISIPVKDLDILREVIASEGFRAAETYNPGMGWFSLHSDEIADAKLLHIRPVIPLRGSQYVRGVLTERTARDLIRIIDMHPEILIRSVQVAARANACLTELSAEVCRASRGNCARCPPENTPLLIAVNFDGTLVENMLAHTCWSETRVIVDTAEMLLTDRDPQLNLEGFCVHALQRTIALHAQRTMYEKCLDRLRAMGIN